MNGQDEPAKTPESATKVMAETGPKPTATVEEKTATKESATTEKPMTTAAATTEAAADPEPIPESIEEDTGITTKAHETEAPEVSEASKVPNSPTDLTQPINWQAVETIPVQRDFNWYICFVTVTIILMALAIFVFKSWSFAILIPVMAMTLVVMSKREPSLINYSITPQGVSVGQRDYAFGEFRSFGLMQHQGQHYAVLLPVKRFAPELTIYFAEEDGERIVDMLGARLPLQEMKPDIIEKFIRIIKL